MSKSKQEIEYTTIVGGGITALTLAGELATIPHEGNISIRESTARVGGRLHTVEIPNSDGLYAEMGGMRFLDSQKNIQKLINELGLETVPADKLSRQCFHYARGQKIYLDDYKDPNKIPYKLLPKEQGKNPSELQLYAYECIVPGYTELKDEAALLVLLDKTIVDGKSLHNCDLGELVQKILSKEAYQLICDAYGFEDVFEGHNAYDKLIHDFQDLQPGKKFIRLKNGMGSLVDALEKRTIERGVNIYTDQELMAITLFDPNAEYPVFVLSFASQNDVYARHIILTISPMALLTLDKKSVLFHNAELEPIIKSTKRSVTAVKVFLIYDKPWWHDKELKDGRLHTSTSSKQIFDFSSTERGAMLCIYKDSEPNWPVSSPNVMFTNQEEIPANLQVPQEVVAAIVEEFRLIFKDESIQMPHTALWKVWRNDQAAFFQWRPKFNSTEVKKRIENPYPKMFITGDNFGKRTGWVETALEEAQNTLNCFKGI